MAETENAPGGFQAGGGEIMKTATAARKRGFSMLDLAIIIAAVAGIVFVIIPSLARSRQSNCRINCTNNLKQVGLAFRIWATDSMDSYPMGASTNDGGVKELAEQGSAYAIFLSLSNELNTPKILICPDDPNRQRRAATVFAPTAPAGGPIPFTPTNNLSYFVGIDAAETMPTMILSGDDHLEMRRQPIPSGLFLLASNAPADWQSGRHRYGGNIALADGSVQGLASAGLRAAITNTGVPTNRLAMP